MASCFATQWLLNTLHVSNRILQQHLSFIFFHSTFDVGRSMFDVRSFSVSFPIKLAASAARGCAETPGPDLV
jgi:hypothetical protein